MQSFKRLSIVVAFSAVCFGGCGGNGPEVVEVAGTITRNGKPVPNLVVNFIPAEGRPSWGATDSDGRFALSYTREQNGAKVGEHKVWVVYKPRPRDPNEEMAMLAGKKLAAHPEIDAILQKYGSEAVSPLRITISKPEKNLEIKLE